SYLIAESVSAIPRELYRGNGLDALHWHYPASRNRRVMHVDHHLAHAWSTFALSGFDEALVVVLDGRGARQATTLYYGAGTRLDPIRPILWPNSFGAFSSAFPALPRSPRHHTH